MRTLRSLMASFLLLVLTVAAQKVDPPSALSSLVETERAFASAAQEKGIREAFLLFIADDGILFRPTAVNGRKWMQDHPVPASNTRPSLIWRPIFADVSEAGDLGYTTGPWEFKQDTKDKEPAAYGNFITVWKRQADGSWKFALDLGITNPQPTSIPSDPQPDAFAGKRQKSTAEINIESERRILLERERELSHASGSQGAAEAFLAHSTGDVRLYRTDSFPFIGQNAVKQFLVTNKKSVWTWFPASADVARSGDLGYTYGTYELKDDDAAKGGMEKGNYLRIWKKQSGVWRVVLDVRSRHDQ